MPSLEFWRGADNAFGVISVITLVAVAILLVVGVGYYGSKSEYLEGRIQNSCLCLPEGD